MTARTDDYDEIVRVVQFYVDAFNDNDVSKLKEAFDEDAWIFFIDADGILHKNLYPYPAEAGCATSAGRRRMRSAPPGMTPAVSWS